MVCIPPKKQIEKQTSKPAKTSLPLPRKYSKNFWQSPELSPIKRQSSSEFPIRDRKGKGKAKSLFDKDKEIKELINDTMSQIFGALKFEDTPKGLDYVINRALEGDNWTEKPPTVTDEQHWFQGLTAHKPMPSSSQVKGLTPKYFTRDKKQDCFTGTSAKEE